MRSSIIYLVIGPKLTVCPGPKGGFNYKCVWASPTKVYGSPLLAAGKIKVFSLKFMRKHSMMMMYLGTQQLEAE